MKTEKIHVSIVLPIFVLLLLLSGCVTIPKEPVDLDRLRATVATQLDSGWDHLWNDRYREAESHFREALDVERSLPEVYRGLGLALYAQGDYFQAAEMLMSAIEANPFSPFAVPMRDFIVSQIPLHSEIRERLNRANNLLAQQKTLPWARREGLLVLQDYSRWIDPDAKKVLQYSADLGVATDWRILGPFTNVAGSGFVKAFITETDTGAIDFNETYLGINNRKITWISPHLRDNTGIVSFSEYLGPDSSFSGYAYSTVNIDIEGDYYITFLQAGTLKCWLDDEPILSDGEYRYCSEVHWIKRCLERGQHRVLIKVTNKSRWAGFKMSIHRADADIYTNRSSSTYVKLLPQDELSGFDPLLADLAAQLDSDEKRRENAFWLSYMLMVKGYCTQGLGVIDRVGELYPNTDSAYFDYLSSLIYNSIGKFNEARNTLVHSHSQSVMFAPAVVYLMREYSNDQRWERLESLLAEAEEAFGQWYYGDLYRLWLTASRDGVESSLGKIEQFYSTYPHSPELDLMLLDSEFGYKAYSPITLLNRVREKGLPVLATLRLVRQYLDWGNYQGAYYETQFLQKHLPASADVWSLRAQAAFYGHLMSYGPFRALVTDLLKNFPYSSELIDLELSRAETAYYGLKQYQREWRDSAELQTAVDEETEKYRTILETYLNLHPDDYDARNELRELNGESPFEKLVSSQEPLTLIEEFKKENRQYIDDAVIVLSEDIYMYFGDGGARSYRQDIIKILSRRGVQDNSSYVLDYHPLLDEVDVSEAYILKPDGSHIRPDRALDRLSFPGLDVGDYIIVRYTRNTRGFGALSHEFWGNSAFNGFYPIYRKEVRLIYPDSYELALQYHNQEGKGIIGAKTKLEKGMMESSITAKNMEPVRYEGWMPDWKDVLIWVDFSSIKSWHEIVEWYREMSEGRCIITPEIRGKLDQLMIGNVSREEKIGLIYDFVAREIEYEDLNFMHSAYVPQEAESVLEDGYGDCKDQCTLLITLLKAAGIDSYIALSTPDYTGNHFYLPSTRFSHTVVIIPEGERLLILDPTTQHYNYPEMPAYMIGSYYLPIAPEEAGLSADLQQVALQTPLPETYYLVDFRPTSEQGSIRGTGIYCGYHASYVRSLLLSNTPEYRMQAFGLLLQEGVPGLKLSTMEASNTTTLQSSPMIDFTGTTPNACIPAGSGLVALEIPWFVRLSPELMNIGSTAKRESTINIDYFELTSPSRQVTVVDIPSGYELYSMPDDADFEFRDMAVSYRYKEEDGKLTCERYLYMPVMSIAAEELDGFSTLMEQIFKKEQERIMLKRAGS